MPSPGAAARRSPHEQDSAAPLFPCRPRATAHPPAGRNQSPRASARRGAPGLGRQPCPRPSAASCAFARSGLAAPLLGHWLPTSKQEAASRLRAEAVGTGQTERGEGRPLETRPGLLHGETAERRGAQPPARSPQPAAHTPLAHTGDSQGAGLGEATPPAHPGVGGRHPEDSTPELRKVVSETWGVTPMRVRPWLGTVSPSPAHPSPPPKHRGQEGTAAVRTPHLPTWLTAEAGTKLLSGTAW